ncbi:MAG: hypothetical protein M3021_08025, partial [Actinomycetota bacterium]|nr:hypothetical protein [Actinomycetota bacterium]
MNGSNPPEEGTQPAQPLPTAVGADPVDAGQVEAVMRAASVLLAVVAQSVAEVEDVVTTPQLRVLVLIATHGPQ